ncbi:hypothetical protein [Paenibacillus xylaniclasticus]|uniref:hypothetical protein n=1 Tax=Paenibacillus xylaniclasticus TaxID=588083 RepID=UPI000FD9FA12|nr:MULTISPECIES: hypothetical protein [Paenibacillus]GFN30444.1 hypothetical protein PCURB6_07040 [Paenibacillus curdlanolyticus]
MSIRFSGDSRIYWSKAYESIYHPLRELGIFPQNAQTFMFCACLGFKYDRSMPVTGPTNDMRLSTFTENELIPYVTIAFSKEGIQFERLGQIEDFKHIVEEYAEGGMQEFIERFLEPYLIRGGDGTYVLDIKNSSLDFEKDLLVFIYEEMKNVNLF